MDLPLTDSCRCRCAQDSSAAAQRSLPELQQVGSLPHLPAVNLNTFAGSGMQSTVDALPAVAPTTAVQQYAEAAQVGHLSALHASMYKGMEGAAGTLQAPASLPEYAHAQAKHALVAEMLCMFFPSAQSLLMPSLLLLKRRRLLRAFAPRQPPRRSLRKWLPLTQLLVRASLPSRRRLAPVQGSSAI